MRTLKFYGASDDLFEIEGTKGDEPDEVGCFERACTVTVIDPTLAMVGMHVTAQYAVAPVGCWMIGITQLDEDINLPNWPMRWGADGYSITLEIDVPSSVQVRLVGKEED